MRVFTALLKIVLGLGMLALALFIMVLAWWTALLLIGGWLIFLATHRMRGGAKQSAPPAGKTIIEGEYRVEPASQARSVPAIADPDTPRTKD